MNCLKYFPRSIIRLNPLPNKSPELHGGAVKSLFPVQVIDLANDALLELAGGLVWIALPLRGGHVLPRVLTQGHQGVGLQGHCGDDLCPQVHGEEEQVLDVVEKEDVYFAVGARDAEPGQVPVGYESLAKAEALALAMVGRIDVSLFDRAIVKRDELGQSEAVKRDL